jgi:hypothetical protein
MRPTDFALAVATALAAGAAGATTCSASSAAQAPTVVELYTSEGCDSCPPADRWLSGLKGRTDVLALAFHVDYWDRLGWRDRFASPTYTERQHRINRATGARFVYTPQVVVNGRDWPAWSQNPVPLSQRSLVEIDFKRAGDRVEATLTPRDGAPASLGAYWVAVEHGHVSRVTAGENAGATLRHDHVVRAYAEIAPWSGRGPHRVDWQVPAATAATAGAEVAIVVIDAASGRPIGALRSGC